ncbi:MAG: dihydropteroate synthase [Dehalococcoidia bacterium]|nr:dihydropteroate synthase [Dehalococcoidia bacterium]
MFTIANNITTRSRSVADALRPRIAESFSERVSVRVKDTRVECLQGLASRCLEAGADALEINLQQRFDSPETMRFAVESVQDAVDAQLCLSAHNPLTLEAGLRACKRPPILNYLSLDVERLQEILPLASRYDAELIVLIADPLAPSDVNDILKTTAVLVGAANNAGIPNERIIVDPGVVHITSDIGPRWVSTILELLPALSGAVDPPVRTTCWINNISAGIPARLRPFLNSVFLSMLAGAGLSSAFVDALNRSTMRAVRAIKVLRNQVIYSDREIEGQS